MSSSFFLLTGRIWLNKFKKRHPELSLRAPSKVSVGAAMVTEGQIRCWFARTEETICNIPGGDAALGNPKRMFNCDESGFPLDASTGRVRKVFAAKGARHVHQRSTGTKEQITVLGCANAAGDFMPPFFVYPGANLTRTHTEAMKGFPEAYIGLNESGWMKAATYVAWLQEFVNFVDAHGIEKPVILFNDSHASHLSLDACRFCRDNGIIYHALLENSTFITQPFDVGIYSELKTHWKKVVGAWAFANMGCVVDKCTFPGIFRNAWIPVATRENGCKAFQRSGLFPFNPDNVDYTRLVTSADEVHDRNRQQERESEQLLEITPRRGKATQLTIKITPDGKLTINMPDADRLTTPSDAVPDVEDILAMPLEIFDDPDTSLPDVDVDALCK